MIYCNASNNFVKNILTLLKTHRFLLHLSVIFLTIAIGCNDTIITQDIYISPNGNDKNNGTKNSPVHTLAKASVLASQSEKDKSIAIWRYLLFIKSSKVRFRKQQCTLEGYGR